MAKPTHPVLVELFSNDLTKASTENTEVWQATLQIMAPKGTNIEQMIADVCTGNYLNNIPAGLSYIDITKVK